MSDFGSPNVCNHTKIKKETYGDFQKLHMTPPSQHFILVSDHEKCDKGYIYK